MMLKLTVAALVGSTPTVSGTSAAHDCRLAVVVISCEPLGPQDGRQFRPEHLDRDLALVFEVLR